MEPSGDSPWSSLDEFRLSMYHRPAILKLRKETYSFIWWSGAVSTGTIAHIIFGTLMFSSVLFISSDYALRAAGRYLAATLVCRAIIMFEHAGMRMVVRRVVVVNKSADKNSQGGVKLQPLTFPGGAN